MNAKQNVTLRTQPAAPPQSATHLAAALILIAGTAAAFAFQADSEPASAPRSEPTETLVRRAATTPQSPANATTQLLGYVEPDVRTGTDARPEGRTAARIDQASTWSEIAPPPPAPRSGGVRAGDAPKAGDGAAMRSPYDVPAARIAAAGSPPWAMMRPFDAAEPAAAGTLTSTPANTLRRHTVRDGDTLGDLAERYYGDARRYREIFDANRGTLSDPQLLPIGATLAIPAFDPRVAPPPAGPTAAKLIPQVIVPRP